MTLLIVDDEYYSVENLRNKLDWPALGFQQVLCAYSMAQAQEIFAREKIHVMLCDIEMPQGSGLSLLEWVRDRRLGTECVFLTCYAKFDYASKALHLGSCDYLLKPVEKDELAAAIARAIERVQHQEAQRLNALHADYWASGAAQRAKQFWFRLANGLIAPTRREIDRELRVHRLTSGWMDQTFCPVLLDCVPTERTDQWEINLYEYAVINILQEVFFSLESAEDCQKTDFARVVVKLNRQQYLIPLPAPENRTALLAQCKNALTACADVLPGIFRLFAGGACRIEQIPAVCSDLQQESRERIARENMVFDAASRAASEDAPAALPDKHWGDLLLERRFDELQQEIQLSLLRLSQRSGARRRDLTVFYHDFSQMLYAHLDRSGASAHKLFATPELEALSENACSSVRDMERWTRAVLAAYREHINAVQEASTVIEEVRRYIREHLAEELSRNELAAAVYLSPDYLSHLFPEKTGMSLTAYITGERIRRAKELLVQNHLSIRDVALASGFQNISYFSKQFKRVTGMTPQEFRKGADGK